MKYEDVVPVSLNAHELRMVATVGLEHHIENIVAGRKDTAWGNGLDLTSRVKASWAEYAAGKVIGVPWEPRTFEERHAGDVGGCEVRNSSRTPPELPIRPRDLENPELRVRPYILVFGDGPDFWVTGWCYPEEALTIGLQKAPDPRKPPAWFVPWAKLHPIRTLPAREAA